MKSSAIDPAAGALLFSLRLNFGNTSDRIAIRGLALHLAPKPPVRRAAKTGGTEVAPGKPDPPPAGKPAAATASPLPAIWSERMCWVQQIDGAPAIELGKVMRDHGYTAAVLYYDEGHGLRWPADAISAWFAGMKKQGLKVLAAAWVTAEAPEGVADRLYADAKLCPFDGFVVNGEKPVEGGGPTRDTYWSARFVRRFRELAGRDFPLGWSPEPRLELAHDLFRQERVCYMPQAYAAENGYTLADCVRVAVDLFGYVPAQVKPLIGLHERAVGDAKPDELAGRESKSARDLAVLEPVLYPAEQILFRPEIWKATVS